MAEKKECEKSQNIVDEASEKEKNFEGDYRENAEGLFAIDGRVR